MISMHSSTNRCWNSSSTASLKLLERSAVKTFKNVHKWWQILYYVCNLLILVWKTLFHSFICRSFQQLQWSDWRADLAPHVNECNENVVSTFIMHDYCHFYCSAFFFQWFYCRSLQQLQWSSWRAAPAPVFKECIKHDVNTLHMCPFCLKNKQI